jgi:hypothetical protein
MFKSVNPAILPVNTLRIESYPFDPCIKCPKNEMMEFVEPGNKRTFVSNYLVAFVLDKLTTGFCYKFDRMIRKG